MLCPLGRLKKVEATKEKTTLIDGAGDKQAIEARVRLGVVSPPTKSEMPTRPSLPVTAISAVAPRQAHRAATRCCWSGSRRSLAAARFVHRLPERHRYALEHRLQRLEIRVGHRRKQAVVLRGLAPRRGHSSASFDGTHLCPPPYQSTLCASPRRLR